MGKSGVEHFQGAPTPGPQSVHLMGLYPKHVLLWDINTPRPDTALEHQGATGGITFETSSVTGLLSTSVGGAFRVIMCPFP